MSAKSETVRGYLETIARLEAERDRLAAALQELDAWVSSMPDAGFTSDSPRWDWWHRRPRETLAGVVSPPREET